MGVAEESPGKRGVAELPLIKLDGDGLLTRGGRWRESSPMTTPASNSQKDGGMVKLEWSTFIFCVLVNAC